MATLYEYLADSTRTKYPLESLDPKAAKFLSTPVPATYSQAKLARIVGMAEKGIGKFARSGVAPAAPAPVASEPLPAMQPSHGPARAYDVWPRGKQLYAQAMESVGHELSQEPLDIPPPEGAAERVASIAGNLAGFIPKAAVLSRIPGASHAGAVGAAMALSRGTLKERAVRGVTGAATAGAANAAGVALRPATGPVGSFVTSSVGFGAAQPAAESMTHRLTGDPDYPAPTFDDLVRGTLEMGGINLVGALAGAGVGRLTRGRSRATVIGPERQLPPARVPKSRQLPPAPAEPGAAREMPGDPNAAPGAVPVSRRLPAGTTPPSGEPILMGAGETPAQRRAPVLEKLAPEFARDTRSVAAGRTVADVFAEMVEAEAGNAPDRAAWKAAVRKVVSSGRIQAVQDIAEALAEPGDAARRGVTPDLRAREQRFTEELNARAAGRTVTLNLDGEPVKMTVARVAAFRYPGVEKPVRVIVADPASGRLFPLRFGSVAEFAQAVNNPQAMVKAEDVFARSERQRAVKAARGKETAGAGGPDAAPVAAKTAAAPAASPAEKVSVTVRPSGVKIVEVPHELLGSAGKEKTSWRGDTQEGVEIPPVKNAPIPPEKADEYVAKFAEGFAKEFASLESRADRRAMVDQLKQRGLNSKDPVEKRAALAALEKIRGGTGGSASRGGTGRQAPPPTPAKVERKRSTISLDFADPKKAQAMADRLNSEQPDLEARVVVKVAYGASGWREFSTPEANARALPKKAEGVARRAAAGAKLAESIYEKVKGNPRAARELVRKYDALKQEALDKAEALRAGPGRPPARENEAAYGKLRAAAVDADRAMGAAEEVRQRVLKEVHGRDDAMHPDIRPFFEREKDADAYVGPMREVAEDFPQHFTLERQARYLHRAATMELPNASEWKAELDFERGMAERGVAPEHAAYATEATGRLRRFIEQARENPLFEESDVAPYREMLKPERVDSPEALAKTLKEFDEQVPPGPADDIPAGVQPEPPDGFVRDLSERGVVNAEALAPWLWLKHLREIPRAFARARRNVSRQQRKYTIYDASGNVMERGEHALYEPDYYSESALTRVLAHLSLEPGAHVLTPELRSSYKASISDHARLRAQWRFELYAKLGPDLAQKVRAFSKRSMQLDRVLEGLAQESSLPPDVRPAVKAFKDWYAERWEIIKKEARDLGEPEPTSKLEGRYVGPRLILGHISKTVESMFSDLLGEGRVTPEITEARNRFLHERTGDPVYREDAMYRASEYIDTMSRYLAHRRFFKDVKEFVQGNRLTDHRRVGAIVNLLKATLLRKKGWFERTMDSALATIRYAKAPPEIREESLEAAAHLLKTTVEQLKKGAGLERVFVVPRGATFRVGGNAKSFELGVLENGATLVGTGGAHLFGEMPVLWKAEAALKRKAIRVRVEKLALQERANKKASGEEGGYLSPFFTKDEHVQMMFDEWRDSVLRSRNDLTAAAFRGMGDRLTRAVLGNNLRAVLQNSMQPWLTLAPEIGYRRTLQAIIENSLGGKRGKLMAEMTGSLQGELTRTEELMQPGSWFRRVNDAFGPMSGYKYAEDFTRGVGMVAGEIMGRRMGLKPGVAMDLSGEINPRFFEDWQRKTEAMRKGGSVENLQGTLDTETMYDYNMLGQSPIFGGAMGKLFGRLMTFPGRYFRRGVTRPLGGAAKVARALVLGGADRATGGALAAAGMPVGAAGKFRRGYKARGKYTGPANAFESFLDYYGARAHDRQGARVFLRQIQGMGMLAGIAAATGLNAFIVGTPGWERVPLMALLAFIPPGTTLHARVKKLLDTTQRSAVIDPERGIESTMGPIWRTGYTLAKEQPQAFGAAYRKAAKGDPAGAAGALSKPLVKAVGETGRQMLVPSLVAVRRLFQQMPMAEPFFKSDAGKAFAHLMGIKTYIKGNGAWGFVKGTLGLAPVVEEEKRRVRVDEPPKKIRARRRSRSRGSIYSTVVDSMPQGAFA